MLSIYIVSLHYVPDALSRMFEDEAEGLNAISETTDTWYEKRIKAIDVHLKLFKNWTVHKGRIYFHNKDQLLDLLEIDELDSWKLVLPTELWDEHLPEFRYAINTAE